MLAGTENFQPFPFVGLHVYKPVAHLAALLQKLRPLRCERQHSKVASLIYQRWASSFWEMHLSCTSVLPQTFPGLNERAFCHGSQGFGRICTHVAQQLIHLLYLVCFPVPNNHGCDVADKTREKHAYD